MPKKHQRNFKIYQSHGSPSQTSNQSSPAASSQKTVNERLAQLRKEQNSRLIILQNANEMASVATQRTVPPELRNILDVPEIAPPRLRPGVRPPRMLRRTAGPAPPPSWLENSIHTPPHVRARNLRRMKESQARASCRHVPKDFSRLAKLEDASPHLPSERSLLHQTLKAMAQNWEFVSEYEQNNLGTIPVSLKSLLMSYLSMYSSDQGIDIDSLKVLFLREPELEGGTGAVDLTTLDLTGLMSFGLSLADLQRYLTKPIDVGTTNRKSFEDSNEHQLKDLEHFFEEVHLDGESSKDQVLDSWEDGASVYSDSLVKSITITRFPDLCRLSLAHAGAFASWKDLLTLSRDLPRLTHLSLAYWPVPTMTPNSRAVFIEKHGARINVSGTHLYSLLDSDWHEATNILRRLSNNTYCLQWLDLEGCTEWVPALIFNTDSTSQTSRGRWIDRTFGLPSSRDGFKGEEPKVHLGIPWNGSWSQVTYVNVSQGCLPVGDPSVSREWFGIMKEIATFTAPLDDDELELTREAWKANIDRIGSCDRWCESEQCARLVHRNIRIMRQEDGGLYCHFDHGWTSHERDLDRAE